MRYAVTDQHTGQRFQLDWDGAAPPTTADLDEIFAAARQRPAWPAAAAPLPALTAAAHSAAPVQTSGPAPAAPVAADWPSTLQGAGLDTMALVARGLAGAPSMARQGLTWTVPGASYYDALRPPAWPAAAQVRLPGQSWWEDNWQAKARAAEARALPQAPATGVVSFLQQGIRTATPSLAAMGLGAATGNPAAVAGALFGASTYDRSRETAPATLTGDARQQYALSQGLIEGGVEAVSDVLQLKLAGLGRPMAALTRPVKTWLGRALQASARSAGIGVTEFIEELVTEAGQWGADRAADVPTPPLWDRVQQMMGPAAAASTVFAALGLPVSYARTQRAATPPPVPAAARPAAPAARPAAASAVDPLPAAFAQLAALDAADPSAVADLLQARAENDWTDAEFLAAINAAHSRAAASSTGANAPAVFATTEDARVTGTGADRGGTVPPVADVVVATLTPTSDAAGTAAQDLGAAPVADPAAAARLAELRARLAGPVPLLTWQQDLYERDAEGTWHKLRRDPASGQTRRQFAVANETTIQALNDEHARRTTASIVADRDGAAPRELDAAALAEARPAVAPVAVDPAELATLLVSNGDPNAPVAAPPRPAAVATPVAGATTLTQFVRGRGGIALAKPDGGPVQMAADFAQLVAGQDSLAKRRGLIDRANRPANAPDSHVEAAVEAGFLPAGSTPADLYNALDEELRGQRFYYPTAYHGTADALEADAERRAEERDWQAEVEREETAAKSEEAVPFSRAQQADSGLDSHPLAGEIVGDETARPTQRYAPGTAQHDEALAGQLADRLQMRLGRPGGERVYRPARVSTEHPVARTVDAVAQALGLRVVWLERTGTGPRINGLQLPGTNVIGLSVELADPVLSTVTHEATHRLKQANPRVWNELVRVILQEADPARVQAWLARFNDQFGPDLPAASAAEARDEFIPELVGELAADAGFWQRLAARAPGPVRDLLQTLLDVLERSLQALGSRWTLRRRASDTIANLERVRTAATEALATLGTQAGDAAQAGVFHAGNATLTAPGVMLSRRRNLADDFMAEKINWGGVALTRAQAVQDMQQRGFSEEQIRGLGGPYQRAAVSAAEAAALMQDPFAGERFRLVNRESGSGDQTPQPPPQPSQLDLPLSRTREHFSGDNTERRDLRLSRATVTAAEDRQYLAAVERGDTATAQQMVDAAARKAGFTIGPVWHGGAGGFTVFDWGKMGAQGTTEGKGFYFTNDEALAKGYAERHGERLLRVYLRGGKQLDPRRLTITRRQIKQILRVLHSEAETAEEGSSPLWNYGDISYQGLPSVIEEAANNLANYSQDDASFVAGLINGGSDPELTYQAVYRVTGKTGILETDAWGRPGHEVHVATSAAHVKLADAITRDDAGRVIPLSERFNPNRPDIRFSRTREHKLAGRILDQPDNQVDPHSRARIEGERRYTVKGDDAMAREASAWINSVGGVEQAYREVTNTANQLAPDVRTEAAIQLGRLLQERYNKLTRDGDRRGAAQVGRNHAELLSWLTDYFETTGRAVSNARKLFAWDQLQYLTPEGWEVFAQRQVAKARGQRLPSADQALIAGLLRNLEQANARAAAPVAERASQARQAKDPLAQYLAAGSPALRAAAAAAIVKRGAQLRQLVYEHYTTADATAAALAAKLAAQAGLGELQAAQLAQDVAAAMQAETAAVKQRELARVIGQAQQGKVKRAVRSAGERLLRASALGALDTEAAYTALQDKLGLPAYDETLAAVVRDRAAKIQQETNPGKRAALANLLAGDIAAHVREPIYNAIATRLAQVHQLDEQGARELGRYLVDAWRLNLFSVTSFSLDIVANAAELAAQRIEGAGYDLVHALRTGRLSLPATSAFVAALRHRASHARRPLDARLEEAFGRTVSGETDILGAPSAGAFPTGDRGTFSTRRTWAGKSLDALVGTPLYAKGAADLAAKRLAAMAALYQEARTSADRHGLRGAAAQDYIEQYVADPPAHAIETAIAAGNAAGFNRALSPVEERIARNTFFRLLVTPFGRWPFQLARWAGQMVGINPRLWRAVRDGRATPEQIAAYLTRTATGIGGLLLVHALFAPSDAPDEDKDRGHVDYQSGDWVGADGVRVSLRVEPLSTALFLVSLLRGDRPAVIGLSRYASLPFAQALLAGRGEAGGLLGSLFTSVKLAAQQGSTHAVLAEASNTLNRLVPGQALLGAMESVINPRPQRGLGARLPGISYLLPDEPSPTTGQPEVRYWQLGTHTSAPVPAVSGVPLPFTSLTQDPVHQLLSANELLTYRGPRAPVAGVAPADLTWRQRREWNRALGQARQEILGQVNIATLRQQGYTRAQIKEYVRRLDATAAAQARARLGAELTAP